MAGQSDTPEEPSSGQARAPAGARWSCHGCGFCCRFHALGPVEPEVVRRLGGRDLARQWPPAASGWVEQKDTAAGPQWYLKKVDGHCVFLADDNTCAVHSRWGPEAKPGFCREYPWRVVHDPQGPVVVVRGDCGGQHQSGAEAGDPLVLDQAADAVALPRLFAVPTWQPAEIELVAGHRLPLEQWMAVEAQLLTALGASGASPRGLVAQVRDRLAAATGQTLAAPDPARADLAYRAALEALRMTIAHVVAHEQAPSAAEAMFAKQMFDRIVLAQHAHKDAPGLSAETRAHANLLLRGLVLGKQIHADGPVLAGLGRWWLVARAAGVLAGRRVSGPVPVDAWAAQYTRLLRFVGNRSIDRVLQAARPALVDMVLHA